MLALAKLFAHLSNHYLSHCNQVLQVPYCCEKMKLEKIEAHTHTHRKVVQVPYCCVEQFLARPKKDEEEKAA